MNSTRSFVSNYNLFFIFVSIIWAPVQIYFLQIDGASRTIFILGITAFLFNITSFRKNKDVFNSPAFICWTILVLYSIINSIKHGFVSQFGAFFFIRENFLDPYVFLVITIIELKNNKSKCLKVILFAQLIYLIIGASHISYVAGARNSNMELGNMLPLTAMCTVFVAGVLLSDNNLNGHWLSFVAIVLLAFYIIMLSAARKAFGGVVIVLLGVVLSRNIKLNLKTLLLLLASAAILYIGIQYLLADTMMGQRLAESSEQFDIPLSSNPIVNSFLMTLLGDRSVQYYAALEIFIQHPITGIGTLNFLYTSDVGYRLHTEYMVQLCENGLIGFILLMVYFFLLFKGLHQERILGENVWVYLFGLLTVVFLNLTTWTYNMNYIMTIYAIIIVTVYSKNTIYENSDSSQQR